MRKLLASLFLIITLGMTQGAYAGPLEDGHAAYARFDYATALSLWRPLAAQGNAQAQNALGGMYARGQGVPFDDKEALRLYRLAAAQGNADAQDNLGRM
jgi:TPR repeat protein